MNETGSRLLLNANAPSHHGAQRRVGPSTYRVCVVVDVELSDFVFKEGKVTPEECGTGG